MKMPFVKNTPCVTKTLRATLALALAFVATSRATAQEKPLIVVSLPSYTAIAEDAGYIGKVIGQPMLKETFEQVADFQLGGLEGLDKSRPLGAAVMTDGAAFRVLGFIPVTDLDKLLATLSRHAPEGAVEISDTAGGAKKVAGLGQTLYAKAKGGWAFLSQDEDSLGSLPDPAALMGGMEKRYDIGIRMNFQNVPEIYRDLAVTGLKAGIRSSLKKNDGETDEQFAERKKFIQAQMRQVTRAINDLDELTIGMKVDGSQQKVAMEFAATAVAGSETAKQYDLLKDLKTRFGGFSSEDAVVSISAVSKVRKEDTAQLTSLLSTARNQMDQQIENSEGLPPEAKAKFKDLGGQLLDVISETLGTGTIDGGMIVSGEGPFTLASGMHVADGAKVDKLLREVVALGEAQGAFAEVKYEAEKMGDIAFHQITPMLPEGKEDIKEFLGASPQLVFGIGKNSFYVAAGTGALESLKGLITKSATKVDEPATPAKFVVALKPILTYALKKDPINPPLEAATKAVAGGADKVRMTSNVIPRGSRVTIELEEGVVKAIAAAAQGSGIGAGAGAGFDPDRP